MLLIYPFRFFASNVKRYFNLPSMPFLVNYSITFRCNLHCPFCGCSSQNISHKPEEELNARDIKQFLCDKELRRLDVIVICGGEPYLKTDINDIAYKLNNSRIADTA